LQSRVAKQAFQEIEMLGKKYLIVEVRVAIPRSKAGISRPSWKPLCAIGNFVKKL